jgi:hypothetical protein
MRSSAEKVVTPLQARRKIIAAYLSWNCLLDTYSMVQELRVERKAVSVRVGSRQRYRKLAQTWRDIGMKSGAIV